MVSTIIQIDNHNVLLMTDVQTYDIFVQDTNVVSQKPIMSVMGLDNAIASVTAIIENDKRLSVSAAFIIRQRLT